MNRPSHADECPSALPDPQLLRDVAVLRPTDLQSALQMLDAAQRQGQPLRPMAGATDLLVEAHFGKPLPAQVLDLWPLRKTLGGLTWSEDGLRIGALATYAVALEDPRFSLELPALAKAASLVGATQIQARGTFAGNVENASPAADAAPMLMAMDAQVELASLRGVRNVALQNYFLGYRRTAREADEIITALTIPAESLGHRGQWLRKVGTRAFQAITKVGLAGVFTWDQGVLQDVRLVAVSMAATPLRCAALEGHLRHKTLAEIEPIALRAAQARDLKPIDDVRSTAEYRAEVFARLVEQALRETAA